MQTGEIYRVVDRGSERRAVGCMHVAAVALIPEHNLHMQRKMHNVVFEASHTGVRSVCRAPRAGAQVFDMQPVAFDTFV